MPLKEDQFDQYDYHSCKEHENGNAVDAMHIPDPLGIRSIGVLFFEVEIFCYLLPKAHFNCLQEGQNYFKLTSGNKKLLNRPAALP